MHGFVIGCHNLRTVQFGRTAFCFNCRSRQDEPVLGSDFGDGQLERPRVHRAAVNPVS